MKHIININQISDIKAYDKRPYLMHSCFFNLKYKKGEKISSFFGLVNKIASEDLYEYYLNDSIFYTKLYTESEVNEIIEKEKWYYKDFHLYKENGTYYERPEVVIKMGNGDTYEIYKDTIEECNEYVNKILDTNSYFKTITIDC